MSRLVSSSLILVLHSGTVMAKTLQPFLTAMLQASYKALAVSSAVAPLPRSLWVLIVSLKHRWTLCLQRWAWFGEMITLYHPESGPNHMCSFRLRSVRCQSPRIGLAS